jgi:hypothetical protein
MRCEAFDFLNHEQAAAAEMSIADPIGFAIRGLLSSREESSHESGVNGGVWFVLEKLRKLLKGRIRGKREFNGFCLERFLTRVFSELRRGNNRLCSSWLCRRTSAKPRIFPAAYLDNWAQQAGSPRTRG